MSELLYLAHHGVKGQKHGVRQYQNKDGSLTALGRIHYGVGKARDGAGKVKEAIRKKVKPTNVELNAQIRKEKSKLLNKKKREQLKQLKKGIDPDESTDRDKSKGQHKKFSEMSDKEIQDRINRLTNEVKLGELELRKNMGPWGNLAYDIAKDSIKQGLTKRASNFIAGEVKKGGDKGGEKSYTKMLKELEAKDAIEARSKKYKNKTDEYESKLAEKKAKQELDDWNKDHPTKVAQKKEERAERKADKSNLSVAVKERNQYKSEADNYKAQMEYYKKKSKAAGYYQMRLF